MPVQRVLLQIRKRRCESMCSYHSRISEEKPIVNVGMYNVTGRRKRERKEYSRIKNSIFLECIFAKWRITYLSVKKENA